MKKTVTTLSIAFALLAGLTACNGKNNEQPAATDSSASDPTSSPQNQHGPDGAIAPPPSKSVQGYRAYAQRLVDRAYKNDPVAIEQLVELNGACNGANAIQPGAKVDQDMSRLQAFCKDYLPSETNKVDWASSYAALLQARLDELHDRKGAAAVADELGGLLGSHASAQEARDALQYAAKSGIAPSTLKPLVDTKIAGTSAQRDQMEALALVEFCRRGGDCGSNDFTTLTACTVLGPCDPGDSLITLVRRKTTPENFEAVQRMSQALAKD